MSKIGYLISPHPPLPPGTEFCGGSTTASPTGLTQSVCVRCATNLRKQDLQSKDCVAFWYLTGVGFGLRGSWNRAAQIWSDIQTILLATTWIGSIGCSSVHRPMEMKRIPGTIQWGLRRRTALPGVWCKSEVNNDWCTSRSEICALQNPCRVPDLTVSFVLLKLSVPEV